MDWTKVGGLLVSPLAKKTILLTVISVSSLLEVCFFTAPFLRKKLRRRRATEQDTGLVWMREVIVAGLQKLVHIAVDILEYDDLSAAVFR